MVYRGDYVYVHEDIQEEAKDEDIIYTMSEKRYTHEEYFEMMGDVNQNLREELTTTQLALVDVYELIGG